MTWLLARKHLRWGKTKMHLKMKQHTKDVVWHYVVIVPVLKTACLLSWLNFCDLSIKDLKRVTCFLHQPYYFFLFYNLGLLYLAMFDMFGAILVLMHKTWCFVVYIQSLYIEAWSPFWRGTLLGLILPNVGPWYSS